MTNSKRENKKNSTDEIVIGVEEKKPFKDFLKKAEEKLKILSRKASEVAKDIEKEAELRVREMSLRTKLEKKLLELGKKVYSDKKYKKDAQLKDLITEAERIEKEIKEKVRQRKNLKK